MLTEEQIQKYLNENQIEYYGLDRDSVNKVLWEFEDALDLIDTLQQQNKLLIEALEWYADDKNWEEKIAPTEIGYHSWIPAHVDYGDKAQRALQQIQGEGDEQ